VKEVWVLVLVFLRGKWLWAIWGQWEWYCWLNVPESSGAGLKVEIKNPIRGGKVFASGTKMFLLGSAQGAQGP